MNCPPDRGIPEAHAARPPESRAAILLAETTETSGSPGRGGCVLRQQEVDVLPSVDYPRDSRAAFVSAVQRDLARSLAFVQLLDPTKGGDRPDDPTTFVVLQADQALPCCGSGQCPSCSGERQRSSPNGSRTLPTGTRRETHGPDRGSTVQARDSYRALQPSLARRPRPSGAQTEHPGTTRDMISEADLYHECRSKETATSPRRSVTH